MYLNHTMEDVEALQEIDMIKYDVVCSVTNNQRNDMRIKILKLAENHLINQLAKQRWPRWNSGFLWSMGRGDDRSQEYAGIQPGLGNTDYSESCLESFFTNRFYQYRIT